MKSYTIPVTTNAGGAGTATGSASQVVEAGQLLGLAIILNGAPNTTDVTITEVLGTFTRTLLTITNIAASRDDYPLVVGQDAAGADIAAWYIPQVLFGGKLTVSVAQSNLGTDILTVIAIVED